MTSGSELRAALEELLGLAVPQGPEVDDLLNRLTSDTAEPPATYVTMPARV
jgi:hypothetical protein